MPLNPNLLFLRENVPAYRICALQGGTRSGKTYSTIQYLIDFCEQYSGHTISIIRETFPAVRTTVFRDFEEIMEGAGLFNEAHLSKPPGAFEYTHNDNLIEFFSIQDEQRVRGRKRDILYVNEVNEISTEKWRQLMFRTTGRGIVDFNPSDGEGWFRDEILARPDCRTLITTFRDNPHLTPWQIEEIERLALADPEYYKVFGEGQFGKLAGIILGHYQRISYDDWPIGGETVYGLDFGYTAPSALVEVKHYDDSHYLRERLYKRNLTNNDLVSELKALDIGKATIYCDSAEPDRIEELVRAGFNAVKAVKDIEAGLDIMRSHPLYITEDSTNLIREVQGYRWKTSRTTNETVDVPVALSDHAIDAGRYGCISYRNRPAPVTPTTATRPRPKPSMFDRG